MPVPIIRRTVTQWLESDYPLEHAYAADWPERVIDFARAASVPFESVMGGDAAASRGQARRVRVARMSSVLTAVLALLGVAALLYPSAASWVSQYNQSKVVSQGVPAQVDPSETLNVKELKLARAYNAKLSMGASYKAGSNEPTSGAGNSLHHQYETIMNDGEGLMARIQIPGIKVDLPVYHGTSDATLLEGIGHLEGSSLPVGGKNTHAVLTGHRGLAEATMFTNLNRVKVGDLFTVSGYGQVLTYQVRDTKVVQPDETRSLRIEAGRDLVTLVTCTPLGINTQRIFVTGERVTPTPPAAQLAASGSPTIPGTPWWAILLAGVVLADGLWLCRNYNPAPKPPRHATWISQ